jgi:hypothetical protein
MTVNATQQAQAAEDPALRPSSIRCAADFAAQTETNSLSTSSRQAKQVFDTIASQANVLRGLLANLRRQPERHENPTALYADLVLAEMLTSQIGALADQMVDGRVVGSLASWCVGPEFDLDQAA